MRRTYLTLLILVALLSLGVATSCIVRSGPGRHSHGVHKGHHKHAKHGKKPKKPKKHKH
ncbi:MAG TPA: hypothetical protein VFU21_09660 [Kofleriaceae bacterium]|nr:hypothetical protein [Kofleriaceae bacterium]